MFSLDSQDGRASRKSRLRPRRGVRQTYLIYENIQFYNIL